MPNERSSIISDGNGPKVGGALWQWFKFKLRSRLQLQLRLRAAHLQALVLASCLPIRFALADSSSHSAGASQLWPNQDHLEPGNSELGTPIEPPTAQVKCRRAALNLIISLSKLFPFPRRQLAVCFSSRTQWLRLTHLATTSGRPGNELRSAQTRQTTTTTMRSFLPGSAQLDTHRARRPTG